MDHLKLLLKRAEGVMTEDIERIERFGKTKKLTPGYARDIREYVKILALIISVEERANAKQKDAVSGLSDEELRQKAKELLD